LIVLVSLSQLSLLFKNVFMLHSIHVVWYFHDQLHCYSHFTLFRHFHILQFCLLLYNIIIKWIRGHPSKTSNHYLTLDQPLLSNIVRLEDTLPPFTDVRIVLYVNVRNAKYLAIRTSQDGEEWGVSNSDTYSERQKIGSHPPLLTGHLWWMSLYLCSCLLQFVAFHFSKEYWQFI